MCIFYQQYSRRSCIRIYGVPYNDEIDVKFETNEIDRVHYIGKPVFDTD